MNLAVSMENSVKAALRADIQTLICKCWHDLTWRQCGVLGLDAGQQDPLAFLLTEAVCHVAVAALALVDAITVTRKLTAPTPQRSEPNAEQQDQLTGPGTIGHTLIEDLQGLPAIVRRRQSSPSSPQKV